MSPPLTTPDLLRASSPPSLLPYIGLTTSLMIATANLSISHFTMPLIHPLPPSRATPLWRRLYLRGMYTMVPTAAAGTLVSFATAWHLSGRAAGTAAGGVVRAGVRTGTGTGLLLPAGWSADATASLLAGLGCLAVMVFTRGFMMPTNERLLEVAERAEPSRGPGAETGKGGTPGASAVHEKMDGDEALVQSTHELLRKWDRFNFTRGLLTLAFSVTGLVVLVKG